MWLTFFQFYLCYASQIENITGFSKVNLNIVISNQQSSCAYLLTITHNFRTRLLLHHYWQGFLIHLFGFFTGRVFFNFEIKCELMYGLLPHRYWQRCFALVVRSFTSSEAKILPLKMGLPSLGAAFSQARFSLVRDSYS